MKDNLKIVKATEGKESSTEATANETVNPPKQTLEERKAEKASCNRDIGEVRLSVDSTNDNHSNTSNSSSIFN